MKIPKTAVWVTTLAVATVTGSTTLVHRSERSTAHAAQIVITTADEPTDRQPELYKGSFLDTTVEASLKRLGVSVTPEDKVFAFPDPALGVGSHLKVYRAQEVTLNDAGQVRTLRTWSKTVGEFAEEQNLELAEKDIVQPAVSTDIPVQATAFSIKVTRVAESELVVTTPISYTTQYIDDPTMDRGTNVTQQAGVNGKLDTTYLVRRENGKEVSRKKLSAKTSLAPVQQIVKRGTKVTVLGTGKASWYGGVGAMTAAHNTLPKGTMVRVVNLSNGKSVVVRIADRGIQTSAIIDLSADAFAQIATLGTGIVNVRLEKE